MDNTLDNLTKSISRPLREYEVGEEMLIVNRSFGDYSKRIALAQNKHGMKFKQRTLLLLDTKTRETVQVLGIKRIK
tara:strand:+ start:172 stop:399 length:228 start_codon:yes stop_codon:yes gene_type:complete